MTFKEYLKQEHGQTWEDIYESLAINDATDEEIEAERENLEDQYHEYCENECIEAEIE